ncbi:MAG: Holliday junction branch migration protein RuvA [Candidatus Planktophila sp.]
MIAQLTGTLRSIASDRIVLDVSGVGYLIYITPIMSANLVVASSVTIHTSMVVREDSLTLYGFADAQSRDTFEVVQTVSGIGPRVALSILAHLGPEQLAHAIDIESIDTLSSVPGIGKKSAQRILLELKGKLSQSNLSESAPQGLPAQWRGQLTSALVSLGYSAREADAKLSIVAIDYANRGLDPAKAQLSELLKAALAGGQ